jgi:hypothetical protein
MLKIAQENSRNYISLINNEIFLQKNLKKTIGISLAPVELSHTPVVPVI